MCYQLISNQCRLLLQQRFTLQWWPLWRVDVPPPWSTNMSTIFNKKATLSQRTDTRWRPPAILDLIEPEIASFDPPTLKTLYHRTKWIGWPVAEIRPFKIRHITRGAFETPILRESGHRGSSIVSLERAMVVSYWLSIVTIALALTFRPQFAIEYLRRSN